VGTGETHSVREFLQEAFAYAGLNVDEHIRIDPRYFRPTEVEVLVADAKKVKRSLNWTPKITFKDLVKIMLDADLRSVGLEAPGEGDAILAKKWKKKWWKGD
jgi:GDPmannose 4,6-dehydratase